MSEVIAGGRQFHSMHIRDNDSATVASRAR